MRLGRLSNGLMLLMLSTMTNTISASEISWSGFMSVAGGSTQGRGETYTVDQETNAMYTDSVSFDPETLVGLQAQTQINDNTRVTVLMTSRGGMDNFKVDMDWLYLSFEIQPSLTLNAGRFETPTTYYSDSIDVGYSYYWIRPPMEVYDTPNPNLEGVNLRYQSFFGNLGLSSRVWYATYSAELAAGPTVELTNETGFNIELEYQAVQVLLGSANAEVVISLDPIVINQYDVQYSFAALMIDYNNWLWRSEYTYLHRKYIVTKENDDRQAWYVSLAYDFGGLVAHLTRGELDENDTVQTKYLTQSNTLGLAWYFQRNTVFKAEYTQSEKEFDASMEPDEVELFTVAIDLLF